MVLTVGAHAATDVTGFGLLGHGKNLAQNQVAECDFVIHTLPMVAKMALISEHEGFKLLQGYSAETSGGLFICLPADKAEAFMKEIEDIEQWPAWCIGQVVPRKGSINDAYLADTVTQISVL